MHLSVPLPRDSWKGTSICYTFMKCGDKACKLVDDEAQEMWFLTWTYLEPFSSSLGR